ncbi:MAG TPA: DUF255 domain-containing protein [Gemmataceae bacterium]|nr:DUF255 domain-containing protein [Gemmataceae bacterium]
MRFSTRQTISLVFFPFSFFLFSLSLNAQELQWRYEYNSARREAVQKNRPLILDFGTEYCHWCRRLDLTTFRDPAIVRVINEQFIALKIDAEKEVQLAGALRIQNYPTLVLAAPDGKILSTFEGYLDAVRLHDYLQRALVAVSNPEWMQRDYQEAAKAATGSDYARAVVLLKSICEDGKDRPIQGKARQLLQEVEQHAAGRLAHAKQLVDKGQSVEAIDALTELLRQFAGTQAAAASGEMLTALAARPEIKAHQRSRRARELLAQAREDYRTQQFLCCLDRCELLASSYGDLSEGAEAVQLAAEIKSNPERMRQACETLSDRLGGLSLALAETWLKKGQPQQAVQCLERVLQSFPGSRQAEAAQVRLSQIQGRPTRHADFKK